MSSSVQRSIQAAASSVLALDLAIERYRTAYAHAVHITVSDSLVMSHLSHCPDHRLTPTELSGRLAMSSGTLTTVVDRLETAGFARRIPNPADGRSVLVALTGSGLQSLQDNRAPLVDAIRSVVPASERSAFTALLEAMAEHMDAAADELGHG